MDAGRDAAEDARDAVADSADDALEDVSGDAARDVGADAAPDAPATGDLLGAFYAEHGGRDALPPHHVAALEALLYGEDDVEEGRWVEARERVEAVFDAYPRSAPIWREGVRGQRFNIGDPVAYYGLRMLAQLVEIGPQPVSGRLHMTAVVAPCARVSRPALPDLRPETVDLDIAPELLADDAARLHAATRLFRRWVQAVTGGLEVELTVHTMTACTTVDFTDDGAVIVSYPDAAGMIASVPDSIARTTDMWWVVAPSGVPGDGAGYGRHFITGGMGVHGAGLPLFLSDDAWFTRKPEHLGSGPYTLAELRAYHPQWFQHEFMHHLYRVWPEFGLEAQPHQWFDRTTWPDDFVGVYEADYYAESLEKRLLSASPSLAEGLQAPDFTDVAALDPARLTGRFQRQPVENGYHDVTVTLSDDGALEWVNAANARWGLEVRDGALFTDARCPYGVHEVLVEGDVVDALWFLGERYGRAER